MRQPFVYRVTRSASPHGFALHLTRRDRARSPVAKSSRRGRDRLRRHDDRSCDLRLGVAEAALEPRAAALVYWFALILITLSIPIHVRSVVIWSTAWVHAFPKYYSHVETPMFLALAYAVTRFRFRGERSA